MMLNIDIEALWQINIDIQGGEEVSRQSEAKENKNFSWLPMS